MPNLEQSAVNSVRKNGAGDQGSAFVKTTFQTPTKAGRLVIAVAFWTGGLGVGTHFSDSRFSTLLSPTFLRDTSMAAWYYQNAQPITSVAFSTDAYRGVNLRLFEVSGIAQASALDKFVWASGENQSPFSGQTSTLTASGEYVFGVIGSQYASTSQSGYTGGLQRLFTDTVPDNNREDWERGQVSFHNSTSTSTSAQRLTGSLSTSRRWIGFLACFKSGVSGPVKFTSTAQSAIDVQGRASLSVFGRLKLTDADENNALSGVATTRARIGPFNDQYRLGGWDGLLIGAGTPYPIESVDGLEGWTIRQTDVDQPREHGSLRGFDLQNAKQVVFKLRAPSSDANRATTEALLDTLYDTLRPQTTDDWELVFRHPGRPLRSLYCRPIDLVRTRTLEGALSGLQTFTLRAADPRLYSSTIKTITIPASPDESEVVTIVAAINDGNERSYPLIRVVGPTSGVDVSRIVLVNATANVAFDVSTALQKNAELLGDMHTRITGGRTSVVTLNGASKYGAWQLPRDPFYIAPAPEAASGLNLLYLRTVPVGSPVTCTITYQDTWSG
jgi:hypothetical protein